jgi:hypothetical protein
LRADSNERIDNLRCLFHFVADITNPMHTVLENSGENDIQVSRSGRPRVARQSQSRSCSRPSVEPDNSSPLADPLMAVNFGETEKGGTHNDR